MNDPFARENTNEKKIGKNLSLMLGVAISVYVAFLLYQAVFLNYQTSQKIKALKADLSELEKDKARLSSLTAYYKTGTFQELEARKKLGLKMPGEKVIQVTTVEDEFKAADIAKENQKISNSISQVPNWEAWLEYLKNQQVQ